MKPPNPNPLSSLLPSPNPNPNPNPNRPSSSSSTACAACKYQRRKCSPECVLAPYFPAYKHHEFLNARRLYGVSNMQKIVRGIHPRLHGETMKSIIYESEARAADPVGGCLRQILDLQRQIQLVSANLLLVNQCLDNFRAQHAAASSVQNNSFVLDTAASVQNSSLMLPLGASSVDDGGKTTVYGFGPMQQEQQYYSNELSSFGVNIDDIVSNNVLSFQEGIEEEDIKLLMSDNGEGKEDISKDDATTTSAWHCSSKRGKLLKSEENDTQHVEEHDLKNAANSFKLTNSDT